MNYRPEIDGLRAIAVVPVIFFHAGFKVFEGGFAGVDVFFVISGYLITSILWDQLQRDNYSYTRFIERRARRILPALMLVLLFSAVVAPWLFWPPYLELFSDSLFASLSFWSNVYFASTTGYFGQPIDTAPLIHTWSLAIEEQFYLLFPILLLLLSRIGDSRRVLVWFVALAILSFGLAQFASTADYPGGFFYLQFRAWELLAGACIALLPPQLNLKRSIRELLAIFSLILILASIFTLDKNYPFPSLYTIPVVLGTVGMILFSTKDTTVGRALSNKIAVFVGLISYSLYLWHQPLFAFAHELYGTLSVRNAWLCIILSFITASLSWRYLEIPMKDAKRVETRRFSQTVVALVLILASYSLVSKLSDGFMFFYSEDEQQIFRNLNVVDGFESEMFDNGDCIFSAEEIGNALESRLKQCFDKYGSSTLLVGDSHAMDLFNSIGPLSEDKFFWSLAAPRCRISDANTRCFYDDLDVLLKQNPILVDTGLYHQAGFYLLEQQDRRPVSRSLLKEREVGILNASIEKAREIKSKLVNIFQDEKIIWLGPRIEPHIEVRDLLPDALRCQVGDKIELTPQYEDIFRKLDQELLFNMADEPRIMYISIQNVLEETESESALTDCGKLYWSDGDHWSPQGEAFFGSMLMSNHKFEKLLTE